MQSRLEEGETKPHSLTPLEIFSLRFVIFDRAEEVLVDVVSKILLIRSSFSKQSAKSTLRLAKGSLAP